MATRIAADIKAAPSCSHCSADVTAAPAGARSLAVVGAPNSGKSTVFNALTGARVKTGNWPGTSVEVARGAWRLSDETVDLIDFPGAYSLEPLSPDEQLTREMLLERPAEEHPQLVIVVVDASALTRGLYLAAQLAEHRYRLIIALTKCDVAKRRGIEVDVDKLAERFGAPVVPVDARSGKGVNALREAVETALTQEPRTIRPVGEDRWSDAAADRRFADIDALVATVETAPEQRVTLSDRIDRVLLHPVFGALVFLAVMWLVFQITTVVAAPLQGWAEELITGPVAAGGTWLLETLGINNALVHGLLIDGFIGGVGMVLSFAPLMALMFLCLAILEDSGYMARAAVVTDRVMRSMGLPGKAFIPLVVGFGCNVPAIAATRVLGTPRHRLLTVLLIPFTSCSARLVVFLMLATIYFPENAGTVVFGMYLISIGLVVGVGVVLHHTLWRSLPAEPLVIDLPTYQLPTVRLSASVTWLRLKGFLQEAGGIIVATVVVVWLLMAIPATGGYSIGDEDMPIEDSVYGATAQAMAPVFEPAGFGSWSLTGPLVTGFVAKEALISTWAQTYDVTDVTEDDPEEQASSDLATAVRADFEQASDGHALAAVWAYMIFLLCYTPCVATIGAQRHEIGWKWTLIGMVLQLAGAWVLAVATFQILSLVL